MSRHRDDSGTDAAPPRKVERWVDFGLMAFVLVAVGAWFLSGAQGAETFKRWMAVAAVVVVALAWFVDWRRLDRVRPVVTAVIVVMAVTTTFAEVGNGTKRLLLDHRVASWNVFHYVLGTKYFDELGYYDFYNGVILADDDADQVFRQVETVSDLRTYEWVPLAEGLARARQAKVRERFTDERWEEFKGDLRVIQAQRKAHKWQGPLRDLGFHPSPAWLIVHEPLLNAVDIQKPGTLSALCAADLVLMLLTIAAVGWAFGARTAALAALWLHLYPGNMHLTVGGYFHYDWLFWTIVAVALYRKKRPMLAGAMLAYPAMMRGFPGLLALYPFIGLVKAVVLRRPVDKKRLSFIVALVLCSSGIVALGSMTWRGPAAWTEWASKIALHAQVHPTGRQRLGVRYLFAHDPDATGWWPSREQRAATLADNATEALLAQLALATLVLLAMLRRRDHDGMLLALGLIVAALVLSRYYVSLWLLTLTWLPLDRRKIGNMLATATPFAMVAVYFFMTEATLIHRYHVQTQLWVVYFVALAGWFVARDVRVLRRWRRLRAAG